MNNKYILFPSPFTTLTKLRFHCQIWDGLEAPKGKIPMQRKGFDLIYLVVKSRLENQALITYYYSEKFYNLFDPKSLYLKTEYNNYPIQFRVLIGWK